MENVRKDLWIPPLLFESEDGPVSRRSRKPVGVRRIEFKFVPNIRMTWKRCWTTNGPSINGPIGLNMGWMANDELLMYLDYRVPTSGGRRGGGERRWRRWWEASSARSKRRALGDLSSISATRVTREPFLSDLVSFSTILDHIDCICLCSLFSELAIVIR